MRFLLLLITVLSVASANLSAADTIATGGNPASLVVHGTAEATAALSDGTILGARATIESGRAAALGHGGFLTDERGDTRDFVLDQLEWLIDGATPRAWGVSNDLSDALQDRGVRIRRVSGNERALDFANIDLIIGSPQAFARAGRLEDLAAWLRAGGAMLSVETAWGQIQLGHASSADDLAANRLLGPYGILYTERALSPGRDGLYRLDAQAAPRANAELALRVLSGDEPGDVAFAARIARQALALVPLESPLIAMADALGSESAAALNQAYAAMADRPLRLADQPLACALLDLEARRATLGEIRAHPSAEAFPGPVPSDLERLTRRVHLDRIPGWRSTGLYAAPGEPITVRVVDGDATGSVIQIGAWLDPQDFDDRVRMPVATFRTPLLGDSGNAASPIGGPIYLDLPSEVARRGVTFEIAGAVEMPRYRHGETDLEDWQDRIRHIPIRWAELESDQLVFTIPADAIRDLDRPDVVMEHWKRIHEAMQAMEPRSPRHWPDRQQRYVAEKRLSWGYMYCPADAPLVIPMTAARDMVDAANFDAEGPNRLWGHYHEMGHSHQNPMWTFDGTGEVTVNIFTVLALHTVNGFPLDDAAMRTEPGRAFATMVQHAQEGAPFAKWKSDPFLALQTYALLWQEFGWGSFHEAFRAYDKLAPEERPRTDDDKRDLFAIIMSRTVGRDLGPYFDAWGIPTTQRVRQATEGLPLWMPEGWDEAIAPQQ
jgi:hypothetical protein